MGTLLWVGIMLLGLLSLFVMLQYIFVRLIVWKLIELQMTLPIFKWFSLDEVVAMGHSRILSIASLAVLKERKQLEIRMKDIDLLIEVEGFNETLKQFDEALFGATNQRLTDRLDIQVSNAGLLEYRLVMRSGKRKKLPSLRALTNLVWQPAARPT